jgi:hypothetical protein
MGSRLITSMTSYVHGKDGDLLVVQWQMVCEDVASTHTIIQLFQKKRSIRVATIVSKMTAKKEIEHNSTTAQAEKSERFPCTK